MMARAEPAYETFALDPQRRIRPVAGTGCGHPHPSLREAAACLRDRVTLTQRTVQLDATRAAVVRLGFLILVAGGGRLDRGDSEAMICGWHVDRGACPHDLRADGLCRWCGDDPRDRLCERCLLDTDGPAPPATLRVALDGGVVHVCDPCRAALVAPAAPLPPS